ncbi:hypothetical protein EJB05_54296, partial [Eragrostis curvula]
MVFDLLEQYNLTCENRAPIMMDLQSEPRLDMLSNKVYDGSVRGHNDEILSQAANKHRPWSVDTRMVHWEVFIRKEGRKISQEQN